MLGTRPLSRVLLGAWLLSLSAAGRAAVVGVRPVGAPLFAPVSAEWGRALGLGESPARAMAPVVAQLSGSLELSPARFEALPAPERQAALSLAQEAASAAIEQKTYELAVESRAALASAQTPDREGRERLFYLVSDLSELREHYAGLLPRAETREELERAHAQAVARAARVRAALLRNFEKEATSLAVTALDLDVAPPVAEPLPAFKPGTSAKKLLLTFKNSPWGRRASEVHALYMGYGFEVRNASGDHRIYYHPRFPFIRDNVPSHNGAIAPNYVMTAIKNVQKLEDLYAASDRASAVSLAPAPAEATAAALSLDDLRVLLSPPSAKKPAEVEEEPAPSARPVLRLKKPTRTAAPAVEAPTQDAQPSAPPPPAPTVEPVAEAALPSQPAPIAVAEPAHAGAFEVVAAFLFEKLRQGVATLSSRGSANEDGAAQTTWMDLAGIKSKNPTRAFSVLKKKGRD